MASLSSTSSAATQNAGPAVPAAAARSQVLQAASWSLVTLVTTQFLRLGSNLLLARLLVPADFGIVAIIAAVLSGLQLLSDIGLGPAIINSRRGESRAFLDTAFTLQSIRGVVIGLVTGAIAWPVSVLYQQPELLMLLPAAGIVSVVSGLASPALFLASRRLDQRLLSQIEVLSFLVQLVVTLSWAVISPSAWAMIAGWLAGGLARSFMSHAWAGRWKDRFRYDVDSARELYHSGRWIFVSTIVTFLSLHGDRLLLGALVPISLLGVYSMAAMLTRLPADIIGRLSHGILFPVLAEAGRLDRKLLENRIKQARTVLIPACMTTCVGIATCGPALFVIAYPTGYRDAVWITPLLAFAGWFSLLQATVDRLLLVLDATRALAVSNALRAIITLIGAMTGYGLGSLFMGTSTAQWHIIGFICGIAIGSFVGYGHVLLKLSRLGFMLWKQDCVSTFVVAVSICMTWTAVHVWTVAGWWAGERGGWSVCGGCITTAFAVWSVLRIGKQLGWVRR